MTYKFYLTKSGVFLAHARSLTSTPLTCPVPEGLSISHQTTLGGKGKYESLKYLVFLNKICPKLMKSGYS